MATTEHKPPVEQPIPVEDSVAVRGLLDREDLLQRLDRAVTKRVTIVSAPPGSGKTSLLRAWTDRSSKIRRVPFVSVDRDQQDAQRFWSAVLGAVRSSAASTDDETQPTAPAELDGDQLVDRIVSEIAQQVEPVVLIIDDLHELKSAEAERQLEHFLAILPGSARVVLSSRRDPAIRLHRLRLDDEVAEIRASDLRFTEIEARELLALSGITLSDRAATALYERTEGWAAGLRLAVIALRGHADPERFVAEFSGTDRAIGEYLMAEMLERQPAGVQSMLLRTSVVDRLNGELADLLTGSVGSEQLLLQLEDANAFVVSLDAQRSWFRYHHLLADFLRLELRRRSADEIPDLHRKAARWFTDHRYAIEGVRHTLAAGDWPDAAQLLADQLFSLTLDGQEGEIAAVLRLFPAGVAADHPELALAHAAVELTQGRLDQAAVQLSLADSHLQDVSATRRGRLAVAIASLRLALARRSGRFAEATEQANVLAASMAHGSNQPIAMGNELRAVALMNLGIVEAWSGQFASAHRHVTEGAALAHAIGRPYLEVACSAYQAFAVSLKATLENGRNALALAESYGLSDRAVLAPALGAVAGAMLWMGDFEEGERWLRRGWEVIKADTDPATAVLLHMVTGMLHAGRAEHQSAVEALTAAVEAQSLLSGAHILAPVAAEWLAATQARLGMPDAARAMLDGFPAEHVRSRDIDLGRAAISLVEGDPATALAVLGDVSDMRPPPGVAAYALVEAWVLTGLAQLALGNRTAAAAAAEEALAAAEADRLIFPFAMNSAAELMDLLRGRQTAHGALLADVNDLLRGITPPRADAEHLSQPDELSASELRVLRYLPTNLTRPEIAQALYVSINTVNTHMRNIYSKLGAHDRSTAVQRARQLRLISTRLSPTSPK